LELLLTQIALGTTESWGLDRVDDRVGLDNSYDPPQTSTGGGKDMHVYVADTGVRTTHTDFGGRAIPTLEVLGNGVVVCNPTDASCANDGNGHGTHCAGTVGGTSFGVAKEVTLRAVKVLSDSGSGSFSWFISALDWVAGDATVSKKIFSASLGGSGVYQAVQGAIDVATANGVVVVLAAGNSNSDSCQFFTAYVPNAITVGSTDRQDARSWFSNYGSCNDISHRAPTSFPPATRRTQGERP